MKTKTAFLLVWALLCSFGFATPPIPDTKTSEAIHFIEQTTLPNINFHEVSIGNACLFLEAQTKVFDPLKKGLKFRISKQVLSDPKKGKDATVSMSMQDASILHILNSLCYFAELDYEISGDTITLVKR